MFTWRYKVLESMNTNIINKHQVCSYTARRQTGTLHGIFCHDVFPFTQTRNKRYFKKKFNYINCVLRISFSVFSHAYSSFPSCFGPRCRLGTRIAIEMLRASRFRNSLIYQIWTHVLHVKLVIYPKKVISYDILICNGVNTGLYYLLYISMWWGEHWPVLPAIH